MDEQTERRLLRMEEMLRSVLEGIYCLLGFGISVWLHSLAMAEYGRTGAWIMFTLALFATMYFVRRAMAKYP